MSQRRSPPRLLVLSLVIILLVSCWPRLSAGVQAAPVFKTKNNRLGQVRAIKHGLSVRPPKKPTVKGKLKQGLYSKYGLSTQVAQLASISFIDGTVLHMNQRTALVLRSPSLTSVQSGEVDEVVVPGTSHVISTAAATASAIGSEFDVRVVRKKKTVVTVVEGAVLVKDVQGSVVVETGQSTSVVKGSPPSPPTPANGQQATSWTAQLPPLANPIPQNLGLAANGSIAAASSTRAAPTNTWDAAFLNDGRLDRGWAAGSVSANVARQIRRQQVAGLPWVSLSLPGGNTYAISSIVIDPAATGGLSPNADLQAFEIWVAAADGVNAQFRRVGEGIAKQEDTLQRFVLPTPVYAAQIKIVVISNYGSASTVAIAELEVAGDRVAVATPVPTPTATTASTPTLTAQPTMTATLEPSPTFTAVPAPTFTATATPTVAPPTAVLGDVTVNTATGAASDNGGQCSAPGEVQTSTVQSLDAYLVIRQPIVRWQGTHTWRADWLDPTGRRIHSTGVLTFTDTTADFCRTLYLSGEPTLSMPGIWTVQTFLDEHPDTAATYTMKVNQPARTGSVSISSVSQWREPDVTPPQSTTTCSFQGEQQSTAVLTTDKAQLNKIAVSSWSGAHTLWGEWWQPDGTLWDWVSLSGKDAGMSTWCLYEYIAGYGAADLPGNWHFTLYVDGTAQGIYPFTIQAPALRTATRMNSTNSSQNTPRLSGAGRDPQLSLY